MLKYQKENQTLGMFKDRKDGQARSWNLNAKIKAGSCPGRIMSRFSRWLSSKESPLNQETLVRSLHQEVPLEKETAIHSSILACKETAIHSSILAWRRKQQSTPVFLPGESHGQRSLVGYSPWGHKRVGHNWPTEHAFIYVYVCVSIYIYVCVYIYIIYKVLHEIISSIILYLHTNYIQVLYDILFLLCY